MAAKRQDGDDTFPHGITLLHTWKEHDKELNRIAWSPDGQYLASSSFDGTVCLWDNQAMELRHALLGVGSARAFYSVAWSTDGRTLAGCSSDRYILLWDRERDWSSHALARVHASNVHDI